MKPIERAVENFILQAVQDGGHSFIGSTEARSLLQILLYILLKTTVFLANLLVMGPALRGSAGFYEQRHGLEHSK